MARRRKNAVEPRPPYNGNEDIFFIDLYLDGELVTAGTQLKIKNDRRVYLFERMCKNTRLETEWVDLRSQENGDWLSVRPEKLKGRHVAKRSRAKKK